MGIETIETERLCLRPPEPEDADAIHRRYSSDPEVVRFLAWGRQGTRLIPGKHGTPAREFAVVSVEIPDAPGALGRLFADIGEAGFNVEDVSIEHDVERERGWLSVQVTQERASELEETMEAHGWTVRH